MKEDYNKEENWMKEYERELDERGVTTKNLQDYMKYAPGTITEKLRRLNNAFGVPGKDNQ